jgi:hypothetical protein
MSELIEKLRTLCKHIPSKFTPSELEENYSSLGINISDTDALKAIVSDYQNYEDSEDEMDFFILVHAWRALYQVNPSEETFTFLLSCATNLDFSDNDWFNDDLVEIIASTSEKRLHLVDNFIANVKQECSGLHVIEGLFNVYKKQPELKAKCTEILVKHFQSYATNHHDVNGIILSGILDCGAGLEHIDLIRAAFAANTINETWAGDITAVEIGLGLRAPAPIAPARHRYMDNGIEPIKGRILPTISTKEREKRAAKKKQAQKSKKANRK